MGKEYIFSKKRKISQTNGMRKLTVLCNQISDKFDFKMNLVRRDKEITS